MSINQERKQKLAFARKMVKELEAALASNAGVAQVSTDGVSVTYTRAQMLKELEYWRKQVIRYSRKNSRMSGIDLGGAYGG